MYFDREQLGAGHAVPVAADSSSAVAQVSCGQIARSQWAVIVDPDTASELPDGQVGEIWLQGNNIGRGYWGLPDQTGAAFDAKLGSRLTEGSHADGSAAEGSWLRTGDLGVYLDGELYVTGRIADLVTIDWRDHYPQDIEATAAEAAPIIRRGYATAFAVPGDKLVIVAERAAGTNRVDPQPAIKAIGKRSRTATAWPSTTCGCSRPVLSPAPPVANWPAVPAARNTSVANWACMSYPSTGLDHAAPLMLSRCSA